MDITYILILMVLQSTDVINLVAGFKLLFIPDNFRVLLIWLIFRVAYSYISSRVGLV